MEKFKVEITQQAESDLASIAEFIAQDNPLWAIEFTRKLQDKITSRLSELPTQYRLFNAYRVMTYASYLVIFSVNEDAKQVVVLGICNSAHYTRYKQILFE